MMQRLVRAATRPPASARAWQWATRIATAQHDAATLDTLLTHGPSLQPPTATHRTAAALARLRHDPPAELAAWQAAIDAAPHQLSYRLQLADALDRAGLPARALQAYRDALAVNANLYLDPGKQLPPTQAARVDRRIAQLARSLTPASPPAP
jgi:hypothetical protein